MRALEEQVKTDGACTLPGVSIAYELFLPIMMRAVARGYVRQDHADFVANGLRYGFDLGVDVSKLRGRRLFRNYPTALEARAAVTKATRARVEQGKSLQLFQFSAEDRAVLDRWPRRGASSRWARCRSRWSQVRCARFRITQGQA